MPPWFAVMTFTLFGLLFGSFANVVVWRLPRGESVVSPGSHCPGCDAPIAWYDNIPLVSWVALRGRCRGCDAPIAVRYPLVEAASGALFALAALVWGFTLQAVVGAAFFWLLLVLSAIDLDTYRLPNPLVALLAVIGIAGVTVTSVAAVPAAPLVALPGSGPLVAPWAFGLLGAALGAGVSGAIAAGYGAVRGRSGLGMGDVKLLGAMGLFVGPYVVMGLFIASVAGMVIGLLVARARGTSLSETRIPFGPSLAAGTAIAAVVGPDLMTWYLGLAGVS